MKKNKQITSKINSIADIGFGLQGKSEESGAILYLQPRHFNSFGIPQTNIDSFINIQPNYDKYLLKDGDVLFAGKGVRNFAWCYSSKIGSAIASANFYVISPNLNKINPEYLAIILNMPEANNYFQQVSSGMTVQSVRKSSIEEFEIPLPDMHTQQIIVDITGLYLQEHNLINQLSENKTKLYNALIKKIIE